MLKKFNQLYSKIIYQNSQNNLAGFEWSDELLETAFDRIGFRKFQELKNNQQFISKLKNTDKKIIKDAYQGLWQDTIENYDDDQQDFKQEAIKFYNYLKQLYLTK